MWYGQHCAPCGRAASRRGGAAFVRDEMCRSRRVPSALELAAAVESLYLDGLRPYGERQAFVVSSCCQLLRWKAIRQHAALKRHASHCVVIAAATVGNRGCCAEQARIWAGGSSAGRGERGHAFVQSAVGNCMSKPILRGGRAALKRRRFFRRSAPPAQLLLCPRARPRPAA